MGLNFFSSAADIYGNTGGRTIVKRVGNTGRRANKFQQIFLHAYFKQKQTDALVPVCFCNP